MSEIESPEEVAQASGYSPPKSPADLLAEREAESQGLNEVAGAGAEDFASVEPEHDKALAEQVAQQGEESSNTWVSHDATDDDYSPGTSQAAENLTRARDIPDDYEGVLLDHYDAEQNLIETFRGDVAFGIELPEGHTLVERGAQVADEASTNPEAE